MLENNADQLFRSILILGFLSIVPFAVYHRIRSFTGERLDRREEGLFLLISIRVIGIAGMTAIIAFMIEPRWLQWSSLPLSPWLRLCGVLLGALAGLLLMWTFRSLGKNLTDTVVTRQEHTLITTGPYRWIRHPFYLSLALAVIANSLVTANWLIFLLGSMTFYFLVLRTKKEEQNLIARFGENYKKYMDSTGRFLPIIRFARASSLQHNSR